MARSSSAWRKAKNFLCGVAGTALAMLCLVCLYMLARKIRGVEAVR